MYNPRSFQLTDPNKINDLIRRNNFATLFSQHAGEPEATTLPFLLDEKRGEHGVLLGHFARANSHWRRLTSEMSVLVLFQGAHAYISPSYYASQTAVPTWNYAQVQVWGKPRLLHEPEEIRPLVEALSAYHENGRSPAWDVAHAEPLMDKFLKAIVGLEIEIERIEAKHKFNQNHPEANQQGVVTALQNSTDPLERETAEIMQANLSSS